MVIYREVCVVGNSKDERRKIEAHLARYNVIWPPFRNMMSPYSLEEAGRVQIRISTWRLVVNVVRIACVHKNTCPASAPS